MLRPAPAGHYTGDHDPRRAFDEHAWEPFDERHQANRWPSGGILMRGLALPDCDIAGVMLRVTFT